MLKDLIKIANKLDATGQTGAADLLDAVIISLASGKPSWIINPEIGLDKEKTLAAASGYARIKDGEAEAALEMAVEQAKSKLRSKLKTNNGYVISTDEKHYEPDMVEAEEVWVRAVAEKED